MRIHFTPISSNAKTGPIPVSTTSADTCPDACPFKRTIDYDHAGRSKNQGCYADGGPLAMHWRKVSSGERGAELEPFLALVRALPDGQLWRHNQAGDLPGIGDSIDSEALAQLVSANTGKRGFTYTHKPMDSAANRAAVANSNANGFTVNLSGNNLSHADELAALDIGPVVSVVPRDTLHTFKTPAGRKGVICPAQTRNDVTCASCGLCARQDRRGLIIGFLAHGSGASKAEKVAQA